VEDGRVILLALPAPWCAGESVHILQHKVTVHWRQHRVHVRYSFAWVGVGTCWLFHAACRLADGRIFKLGRTQHSS
jgi:hypothetical protein